VVILRETAAMRARDILIWAGVGAGAGALFYFLTRRGAAAAPRRRFTLTLVEGWNYISIPLFTSVKKASDLLRVIEEAGGKAMMVARWDPDKQDWQSYAGSGEDFSILPYDGILIGYVSKGCELEIEGEGVIKHTYTLPAAGAQTNVMFIGVPFITGLNASDIYNMLENPAYVCKYTSGTGTSTCYPADEDFPLKCGEAYFVGANNTKDISFTLSGEPCGTAVR